MAEYTVDEAQILKQEANRILLRNNLRNQGIECADDETIDSLASKVANIQSYNKLINKELSGEIVDSNITELSMAMLQGQTGITSISFPNLTSIAQNAFYGCSSLVQVNLPLLSTLTSYSFNYCSSLKELYLPNITYINAVVFGGSTSLEKVVVPRANSSFGSSTFANTGSNWQIADFGSVINSNAWSFSNSQNFRTLILRKTDAITTLSATNVFNGTPFATSGGRLYCPNALRNTYEGATNWSSLAGLTTIALEGSRYEELDWYENATEEVTLDGGLIKVLPTETVAMFKHTEGVSHIYEDGVELTDDTELVKDHPTLTTTI